MPTWRTVVHISYEYHNVMISGIISEQPTCSNADHEQKAKELLPLIDLIAENLTHTAQALSDLYRRFNNLLSQSPPLLGEE